MKKDPCPVLHVILPAGVLILLVTSPAAAQLAPAPEGRPFPDTATQPSTGLIPDAGWQPTAIDNGLPNIMLTGYWPPTNEMLRRFSANPDQNPQGWIGGDWEGHGYNVYAFFAEYPNGAGRGQGDFEVDYQDTSADFWRITNELQPVAIITFGVGEEDTTDWEVESRHQNRSGWWFDYSWPFFPTPNPPDDSVPADHIRYTSLPIQNIVDAVNAVGLEVTAFISSDYAGAFLCEYIGYHGTWYHESHAHWSDPIWNAAAGHIHVGGLVPLEDAIIAIEITLRELTSHLDTELWSPADFDRDRDVDRDDWVAFESCSSAADVPAPAPCGDKDLDGDNDVDHSDFGIFQRCLSGDDIPADPNCAA